MRAQTTGGSLFKTYTNEHQYSKVRTYVTSAIRVVFFSCFNRPTTTTKIPQEPSSPRHKLQFVSNVFCGNCRVQFKPFLLFSLFHLPRSPTPFYDDSKEAQLTSLQTYTKDREKRVKRENEKKRRKGGRQFQVALR